MKLPNITFRRDGCGGAVHSNERKLNDEAFSVCHRAPMFGEFLGSYSFVRAGGSNWVAWMVKDALSLHPNYLNFIGWQSAEARAFAREEPGLIAQAQREMGYRFVPCRVALPTRLDSDRAFPVEMEWVNRGVGRALRDYCLQFYLVPAQEGRVTRSESYEIPTSSWVAGKTYPIMRRVRFPKIKPGDYRVGIAMKDLRSGRSIHLPLKEIDPDHGYLIGSLQVPLGLVPRMPGEKTRPGTSPGLANH